MENVASSSNQAIPFQVNDSVQEFRVTTANADAQFGRNIGGTINIITQRGTAKFHGSVFGFFADSSMNATSPLSVYGGSGFDQAAAFAGNINSAPGAEHQSVVLADLSALELQPIRQYYRGSEFHLRDQLFVPHPAPSTERPPACSVSIRMLVLAQHNSHTQPFSSQQFGAQAGGSFAKRWYWFGDYEGTRIDNPNPIFERVPSSYDRSHLSEFTGQPGFPDAALHRPCSRSIRSRTCKRFPTSWSSIQGQAPNYTNVDNYLGRLDFTQSDRTEWTFRYNLQDLSQLHDDSLPSFLDIPRQRCPASRAQPESGGHVYPPLFRSADECDSRRFYPVSGQGNPAGRQLRSEQGGFAQRPNAHILAFRT